MDWVGIAIIVGFGAAVVAYGWLSDRTADRRRAEATQAPPHRPIPGLSPNAAAPNYVQASDLPASPSPPAADMDALRERLTSATSLPYGHGRGAFAADTASGLAVLSHPLIVVVDGEVSSIRELVACLSKAATAARPLALVAHGIADEVFHTLEANALAGKLACDVVAIPDQARRAHLAELVGASPLDVSDLKSGWLPEESLGTCGTWVSSPTQLWLLDDEA